MSSKTKVPDNYRYTKEHEWVQREHSNDNIIKVGITDFAQHSLGDIVHIELPSEGESFNIGDEIAVVESAKSGTGLAVSPLKITVLSASTVSTTVSDVVPLIFTISKMPRSCVCLTTSFSTSLI